jgi:hypothetical protein
LRVKILPQKYEYVRRRTNWNAPKAVLGTELQGTEQGSFHSLFYYYEH